MSKFYSYFRIVLYLLIFLSVIELIARTFHLVQDSLNHFGFLSSIEKFPLFHFLQAIILVLLILYFLWILIGLLRLNNQSEKTSIFSSDNYRKLTKYGYGILIYSGLAFILKLMKPFFETPTTDNIRLGSSIPYTLGYSMGQALAEKVPFVIIGLFLLTLAQLIKDGYELKRETDLTI